MDGIITGKKAYDYDKRAFSFREDRQNTFLSRIVKKSAVIADLCTGSGIVIEFLRKDAKEIYGIDASKDMINIAKSKFCKDRKVHIIHGDVSKTGLKDGKFDYVVVRMGLHHIRNKKAVVDEAYRLLKENGKFVVMDNFRIYPSVVYTIADILKGHSIFFHYYIKLAKFFDITKDKFDIISCEEKRKGLVVKANIILKKKR